MELALRIVLTLAFSVVWLVGVRWVWTHQLDPKATVSRLSDKALATPDWVATRDPKKIYQGGKAVGEVTGAVEQKDGEVQFGQLANTTGFDSTQPFEYQRLTLRIVRIGMMAGMKVEMTDKGSQTLTGVFENVGCKVVK